MTGKMAIVGDGDSIMVFQAAGVSAFAAENEKKARDILRKIAKDYEVIFLTEELARPLADFFAGALYSPVYRKKHYLRIHRRILRNIFRMFPPVTADYARFFSRKQIRALVFALL